jgi:muramoyltetrapeptide carboxypeptidase
MNLIKPRALRAGDKIGLICPASAPGNLDVIDKGARALEERGYRVALGRHVREIHGAFAGTDEQRVDDLNTFLRNPEIRMIMAIRGGYGCARLLEEVDYPVMLRDPKWLVGYSDLTVLQLAALARVGLVTVSGPMAGVEFSECMDSFTELHFWSLVSGSAEGMNLANPECRPWVPVRGGTAEGPLIGGCLSLVMSLFGTSFLPSLKGSILVLEDIHEHVHRVDRMLVQLRLAGVLDEIKGLVLGYFTDCTGSGAGRPSFDLIQTIKEVLAGLRVPCVMGYAYGHERPKRSLPWGVRARLEVDSSNFRLLESPCS